MEFEIGIACGTCDTYNPMGAARCTSCSNDLALFSKSAISSPAMPAQRFPTMKAGALLDPPATVAAETPEVESPGFRLPGASANTATTQMMSAVRPAAQRPALVPPATSAPARVESRAEPRPSTVPSAIPRRPMAPDLPLHAAERPEVKLQAAPVPTAPARKQPPSYAHLSPEELMDQAKHYLCWQCYTPVPSGHKFCGRCGAEVPVEILNARTIYFSDMQNPAKARLVLIRGEGMDGLSYHLKMEQHVVGKKGQIAFPDDVFVSPKHANFFYRDGHLVVRDEGSLNGVFVRVRGTIDVAPGDTFLAGEQVFRLDAAPKIADTPDGEGTYFYTSPKYPSAFRISQLLQGGALGMTVCARGSALQLGREGCDLNFPADIYMSGSHCRIEDATNGRFQLTDLNSRNGTYIRLKAERELNHGDYVFVGRKLMRVEMNA